MNTIVICVNNPQIDSEKSGEISFIPTLISQVAMYQFWKKNEPKLLSSILTFHQTKNVTLINDLISGEKGLHTMANYDAADDLLADSYEAKSAKEKDRLVALREKCLKEETVYSTPYILAAAHSVVTKYPDLIAKIENPLYIQRAFNFIEGSYIHMIERAMSPPTIIVHHGDKETLMVHLRNKLQRWVDNAVSVACILLSQYGVTGDEKYLSTLNNTFMYKEYDIRKIIEMITSGDDFGPVLKVYATDALCEAMIRGNDGGNHMKRWLHGKITEELL